MTTTKIARTGHRSGETKKLIDECESIFMSDTDRIEAALVEAGMKIGPQHRAAIQSLKLNPNGFVIGDFEGKLKSRDGRRDFCSRTALGHSLPIWFGWMFALNPMFVTRYPYTVLAYECHNRAMASN